MKKTGIIVAGILLALAAGIAAAADPLGESYNTGDAWTNGAIDWARYGTPQDFAYNGDPWTIGAKKWLDQGTATSFGYYYFKSYGYLPYHYAGSLGGRTYSLDMADPIDAGEVTEKYNAACQCVNYDQYVNGVLIRLKKSTNANANYYGADYTAYIGKWLAEMGVSGVKVDNFKIGGRLGAYGSASFPGAGQNVYAAAWPIGMKEAAIILSYDRDKMWQAGSTIGFV